MASRMIGRTACPECGFGAAHVKQSEKCTYRYCPECGSQLHAKTARQVADLMAKTRLQDAPAATGPSPTPSEPPKTPPAPDVPALPSPTEPSPTATPPVEARPKRRGLFA